jgi:hypothetical protein
MKQVKKMLALLITSALMLISRKKNNHIGYFYRWH